ncbi:MAG: sigma-70 family RNA polymerase sigma factor [Ferruginibacter sp.]
MKNINHITGAKWELLLSGEEQDFYDCFNCCYDELYRFGIFLYKEPELVKESIQLLFIEIWKIKYKLKEVNNIKEYVLTIYKRVLYKEKTGSVKYWSKTGMIDDVTHTQELYIDSYEEMMISTQTDKLLRDRLSTVLPQLGERQRELIRMRYFEEKSIDEIAIITSLTSRTIYNTLHNALSRLRELLG